MRGTIASRSMWLMAVAVLLLPAVTHAGGPYGFFPITPCRVVDTRIAAGPTGGPAVAALQERVFPIKGLCGVPVTAVAVTLNVTVVGPGDGGWMTVYPAGTAVPAVSTLNFDGDEYAVANAATTLLGGPSPADLAVRWVSLSGAAHLAHVVIDVSAYYE